MRKKVKIKAFVSIVWCFFFMTASSQYIYPMGTRSILNISVKHDLAVWQEFVELLKSGSLTTDKIRPYLNLSKDVQLNILTNLRKATDKASSWAEWEATPEVFPVEDHVHFLIPLGFGGKDRTMYCFTFVKTEKDWYYRHLENIFVRLDQTAEPPTSEFPDISEEKKDWAREEIYWSEQVRLFNFLRKEKDEEFALRWVKNGIGNGIGYFLGAKTWVPFVSPRKAFILYLCWEQAHLRKNLVTLEKLNDDEARVKLQLHYFFLYRRATHFKQQISLEDYKRIFETIWRERAQAAGWDLDIIYERPDGLIVVFVFKKKTGENLIPN